MVGDVSPDPDVARYVALVTGPPCSGKTTWCQRHAAPGTLVVDHDRIARQLGSPRQWGHPERIAADAQRIAWAQMEGIRRATSGAALVIRTAPDPVERQRLACWLRADRVVVLLPDVAVLMARARGRPDPHRTARAIRSWLSKYRPAPCDELVRDWT